MSRITDGLRSAGEAPTSPMPNAEEINDPITLSGLRGEETANENWLEDPMMAARAALDGYFWGWSGEVGASVAAALYKTFDMGSEEEGVQLPERFKNMSEEELNAAGVELPKTTEKKSYTSLRREMLTQLEEEQADWAENNIALNLGMTVLGGFGSGSAVYNTAKTLLKSTGNLVSTAPIIKPLVQARQQAQVTKSLGALEATPAPLTALQASIQAVPQVGRSALQTAAREAPALAATGVLAGAGFAQQGEDITQAAIEGAVFSVGLGIPLQTTLNYALDGVTRQKIAQQLGKGKDFIPIGLATLRDSVSKFERNLNWTYNKIVNKSFGGDSLIEQQQKRWTQAADSELNKSNKIVESLKEDANKQLANVKQTQSLKLSDAKLNVSNKERLNKQAEEELKREALDNIRQKAVLDTDAAVNKLEAGFRIETTNAAIPSGLPVKVKKAIDQAEDQHSKIELIKQAWSNHGYSMLKNRKFRISPEAVAIQVNNAVGEDAAFAAQLAGTPVVNMKKLIAEHLQKYVGKGDWIDGAQLNKLRTKVATQANDQMGTSAGLILRDLVRVLDDAVLPQLPKSTQTVFKQQQQQWRNLLAAKEATFSAIGKNGSYTPEQYLSAIGKVNKEAAISGLGPNQRKASEIITLKNQRDEVISKSAKRQENKVRITAQAKANKELLKAQKEVRRLELAAKSRTSSAEQTANNQRQLEQALLVQQGRKDAVEGFKKVAAKPDAPIWEKIPATLLLGGLNPLTYLTGGTAGLAIGAGTGRLAATQSVQRALVGQAEWQKSLNKILREKEPVKKAVRTGVVVAASTPEDRSSQAALGVLINETQAKKIKAYDRLSKAGKLANMEYTNPKVYKSLIEANKNR